MKGMQILVKIAEAHDGVIETKTAQKAGVSRASLSIYNKQGKIRRVALGKYRLTHMEQDLLFFLGSCSKQYVFSHDTALFLHGVVKERPLKPSVTIVSGRTPSSEGKPLTKTFYVKRDLFELGKMETTTELGNPVFVYDLERTVIDMIRSRRRMGEEAVFRSLRAYYHRADKDMKKLFDYADKFHMGGKLCQYWNAISQEMDQKEE